uniref:NADH dehydrogenase subunit 4L n=1 Tax=Hammerschmidtiella sp. ZengetLiu-2016 TaxID=2025463 RepID=A0A3Q8B2E5_9BILA|nr:NADH dehydrogenase subunit 4L [Hammerschmidtiella sp. ZengetLiu-2016]AST14937.1 NADH dehydrogenase subunit 4L [Hammerschmidtiella sp. ZengetLiu-2016]
MAVLFVSFLTLMFKWRRLIFILISFEFIMMSLFYYYSLLISEMLFFYFMSFTVMSSLLGLVIMVGNMKFYGNDLCVF